MPRFCYTINFKVTQCAQSCTDDFSKCLNSIKSACVLIGPAFSIELIEIVLKRNVRIQREMFEKQQIGLWSFRIQLWNLPNSNVLTAWRMWKKIYKLIVFLFRLVAAALSQQIRHLFIHERIAEKYWHSGDKPKPCACARDCRKLCQHIMSMVYIEMLCTQKPLEKLSDAHMCLR